MAFAANVSKPKTISKTRAGSSRTVELKGPLPKAMNIGDGTAKKYDLMGPAALLKVFTGDGPSERTHPPVGQWPERDNRTVPVSGRLLKADGRAWAAVSKVSGSCEW